MKKKEGPILFIVVLLIIVGVLLFNSKDKKNNEEVVEDLLGVVEIKEVPNDISTIKGDYLVIFKDAKYGVIDSSGKEILPSKYSYAYIENDLIFANIDEVNYVFNLEGKQILKSSKTLGSFGSKYIMEYKSRNEYVLYDNKGTKIKTYKSEYVNIVGKYIITDKSMETVDGKEKYDVTDYYNISSDSYIMLGKTDGYIYNYKEDKLTHYDKASIDGEIIRLGDDLVYTILGDKLDKDGNLKIHDKYYLNYTECKTGHALLDSDKKRVNDKCYAGHVEEDGYTLLFGMEFSNSIILRDGTFIDGQEGIDYSSSGKIINEFKDNVYTFYDADFKKLDLACNSAISYDGVYYCNTDNGYMFFGDDYKQIGDYYDNIQCYSKGRCTVKKDGKYGLAYKGKLITTITYPYFKNIDNDYFLVDGIFEYTLIKLGTENIIENPEYKEKDVYKDVDVNKIISDYKLDDLKEYIDKDTEFFKKYAYIVLNNDGVKDYRKQMFKLFKVVELEKDQLDEYYFLNSLNDLLIEHNLKLTTAAGYYYNNGPKVEIRYENDTVLYHELMHFVDYRIKESEYKTLYQCGNEYKALHYSETLKAENKECKYQTMAFDDSLLVEGGAEFYTAKYLTNYRLRTYIRGTAVFAILSSLYGEDVIDDIYYSPDSVVNLFLLLHEDGLSLNEYNKFVAAAHKNISIYSSADWKTNSELISYVVKIYKNKSHNYWYNDNEFMYALNCIKGSYMLDENIVGEEIFKNYKDLNYEQTIVNKIDGYSVRETPSSYLIDDGKTYLSIQVYQTNTSKSGYLVVNYDFNSDKIIDYKFYEESWV